MKKFIALRLSDVVFFILINVKMPTISYIFGWWVPFLAHIFTGLIGPLSELLKCPLYKETWLPWQPKDNTLKILSKTSGQILK